MSKSKSLCFLIMASVLSSSPARASMPTSTKMENGSEIAVPRALYQPFFKDEGETDRYIGPFKVDKDPVTNEEFRSFVRENPEWKRTKIKRLFASPDYLSHWADDDSFPAEISNRPVTHVSWFAARKYCAARGKRLLTVAEWEYSSDASDPANVQLVLDWYGKPNGGLTDVASAKTNSRGLRGMHGLIWEWVEDYGSVIVQGDSRNSNDAKGALFCGAGSLRAKDPTQYATFMRFAHRSSLKANYVGSSLGFRCARDF